MVDCLKCLGHHAIVRGNDKNNDVRNLSTAGAHHCERLVSRGIKEGNHALRC